MVEVYWDQDDNGSLCISGHSDEIPVPANVQLGRPPSLSRRASVGRGNPGLSECISTDESFDAAGSESPFPGQKMPSAKHPVSPHCCTWYSCRFCRTGLDSAFENIIESLEGFDGVIEQDGGCCVLVLGMCIGAWRFWNACCDLGEVNALSPPYSISCWMWDAMSDTVSLKPISCCRTIHW